MVSMDMCQFTAQGRDTPANSITFTPAGKEVLRIANDGRIFWNGREVESDDEFRAAMLDLSKRMCSR